MINGNVILNKIGKEKFCEWMRRCGCKLVIDLTRADLTRAKLTGAIIDFSAWPLWCGSTGVTVDDRISAQLLYHALDAARKHIKPTNGQIAFVNKNFHRAVDGTLPKL